MERLPAIPSYPLPFGCYCLKARRIPELKVFLVLKAMGYESGSLPLGRHVHNQIADILDITSRTEKKLFDKVLSHKWVNMSKGRDNLHLRSWKFLNSVAREEVPNVKSTLSVDYSYDDLPLIKEHIVAAVAAGKLKMDRYRHRKNGQTKNGVLKLASASQTYLYRPGFTEISYTYLGEYLGIPARTAGNYLKSAQRNGLLLSIRGNNQTNYSRWEYCHLIEADPNFKCRLYLEEGKVYERSTNQYQSSLEVKGKKWRKGLAYR